MLGPILLLGALALTGLAQQDDLAIITQRRKVDLALFPNDNQINQISSWLSTQTESGTWEDVNYLAGCDARERPTRSDGTRR